MLSVTDICNLALGRIGAEAITDINQLNNVRATICKRFYEQARDAILREHPWNCATSRAALTALSAAPAFGYEYQYQLPIDCLRVIQMEYKDDSFRIEGRLLLTDSDQCNILYIKKTNDTAVLDPLIIDSIAAKLAAMIAFPITQSLSLSREINEELIRVLLPKAKHADAMESSSRNVDDENGSSSWLNSRM
jgi:hypothetical protein